MTISAGGWCLPGRKDEQIGNRLINARGETVAEKPSFRAALRRRRCLVPADGFYEWYQPEGKSAKTPLIFRLQPPAPDGLCRVVGSVASRGWQ